MKSCARFRRDVDRNVALLAELLRHVFKRRRCRTGSIDSPSNCQWVTDVANRAGLSYEHGVVAFGQPAKADASRRRAARVGGAINRALECRGRCVRVAPELNVYRSVLRQSVDRERRVERRWLRSDVVDRPVDGRPVTDVAGLICLSDAEVVSAVAKARELKWVGCAS